MTAWPCAAAHHPPSLRVQWPPAPDEIHRRFSLRPSAATIGRFGSGLRWCCCSCSFSRSLNNTHTHIHFFSYLHTGTDNTHTTPLSHTHPNTKFQIFFLFCAVQTRQKTHTHTHTHIQSNSRKFKICIFWEGNLLYDRYYHRKPVKHKIISSHRRFVRLTFHS